MLLLINGTTKSVARWSQRYNLGILLSPQAWNSVPSIVNSGLPWAIDNGAFSGFDALAYERTLARAVGAPRLLWVVCPDKVGDASETLRLFDEWQPRLEADFPIAFVGQDGQEYLSVPWDRFTCLFIGGSTQWKLSQAARTLIAEAKRRQKWAHMGRVNSLKRIQLAYSWGCDSVDGSSMSMFGDKKIPPFARKIEHLKAQPSLF